jgi:hypothetical protein
MVLTQVFTFLRDGTISTALSLNPAYAARNKRFALDCV